MRIKEFNLFLLSVLLVLLSVNVTAQDHHLPQPQATNDDGVGPPPPGLVVPIDENVYFLAAAGFLLGIYFSRPKKS